MAKKKRHRSEQRDLSIPVASLPAARTLVVGPLVSDRRLYHPAKEVAPVYSPRKSQRRIVEVPKNVSLAGRKKAAAPKRARGFKFSFAVPREVELCVRRARRRQVLFALRRTGKGSRRVHRRRNYWSGVTCK